MSQIDALIQQAMDIHGRDAVAAAALVEQAATLSAVGASEPSDALLRAAEHVLLGHLDAGERLAEQLARLPGVSSARAHAAIALAAGRTPDWQDLAPAERVRAHYNAALALSRRGDFAGMRVLMDAAQALAAGGDAVAHKAWAAMANNIAADMRTYHRRGDGPHAELMLEAAGLARSAWQRAGGWLEVERADWQLAMCAAAAGQGEQALAAARASLQACEAHAADDYEFCFAHQALALAALAAGDLAQARQARGDMAARSERLEAGDRAYALDCLAEIDLALAGSAGRDSR